MRVGSIRILAVSGIFLMALAVLAMPCGASCSCSGYTEPEENRSKEGHCGGGAKMDGAEEQIPSVCGQCMYGHGREEVVVPDAVAVGHEYSTVYLMLFEDAREITSPDVQVALSDIRITAAVHDPPLYILNSALLA